MKDIYIKDLGKLNLLSLDEARAALESGVKLYYPSAPERDGMFKDMHGMSKIGGIEELEALYNTEGMGNGIVHQACALPENSQDILYNHENLAKVLCEFYDQTSNVPEEMEEICENLNSGKADKYLKDMIEYRENFKGKLPPEELTQIYSSLEELSSIAGNGLEGKEISMPVAIESTEDYSDYLFHANMFNEAGLGKEDYYRIVFANDYGNIQPLTEQVFRSEAAARQQIEDMRGLHTISYDDMVNHIEEMRSHYDVAEMRENFNQEMLRLKSEMELTGWELRQAYGQQTFWFNRENANEEMEFDNFQSVQNYLEEVMPEDSRIEHETELERKSAPRRYRMNENGEMEREWNGKIVGEFDSKDVMQFMIDTDMELHGEVTDITLKTLRDFGYDMENGKPIKIIREQQIQKDIEESGFKLTKKLMEKMKELDAETGQEHTLRDVKEIYSSGNASSEIEEELVKEIAQECIMQESAAMKIVPMLGLEIEL